ncbi:MAG: hypothetical protein M3R02_20750, partial [Chloroflexota bacterium]|nr:hypothetical protein [Chloroflexota bacterium]
HAFGGSEAWQAGSMRFAAVAERLGMHLAEAREYAIDVGASLVALVVDNSTAPVANDVDPEECVWTG